MENEEFEERMKIELEFDQLTYYVKQIKVLVGIFAESDLKIIFKTIDDLNPTPIIDSNGTIKRKVIKELIKEKLEFLRDESGMLLKKLENEL